MELLVSVKVGSEEIFFMQFLGKYKFWWDTVLSSNGEV